MNFIATSSNFFSKRFSLATALSLFFLLGFIILLHWNSFNMPFESDEGMYATAARAVNQGSVLYKDVFYNGTPLVIQTYRLGLSIDPIAVWPYRFLAMLSLIFTTIFIGVGMLKAYNKRVALLSMWLVPPLVMFPYLMPFAANTERFMILPLAALLALYLYHKDSNQRWPILLGGACALFALSYKQICLLPIIYIFIVWLATNWKTYQDKKQLALKVLDIFLGGILAGVVIYGPIILNGAWSDFWNQAVGFNMIYAKQFGITFVHLWVKIKQLWANWWVFYFLFGLVLALRPIYWKFFVGLLLVSILSVFTAPLHHYYILVMPAVAILMALGVYVIMKYLEERNKITENYQGVSFFLIAFMIMFLVIWPFKNQYKMTPNQICEWIYGSGAYSTFLESPLVGQRIAQLTGPHDYVFIFGHEPQLLFYANRRHSTRFLFDAALTIDNPNIKKYQEQAAQDFMKHPPAAIVYRTVGDHILDMNKPGTYSYFIGSIINKYYEMVGAFVWEPGKGGYWQEPITSQAQITNSNLVLLRLKPQVGQHQESGQAKNDNMTPK